MDNSDAPPLCSKSKHINEHPTRPMGNCDAPLLCSKSKHVNEHPTRPMGNCDAPPLCSKSKHVNEHHTRHMGNSDAPHLCSKSKRVNEHRTSAYSDTLSSVVQEQSRQWGRRAAPWPSPSATMSVCHELSVSSPCLRQRASSHSTHVYNMRQVTAHKVATARVKSSPDVTTTSASQQRAHVKSQHTCLQQRVVTSSHSTINPNKTIIFTTRESLCRRKVIKSEELKARAHSLTRCGSKKASKSTRTRAAAVHRRAVVVDTKPKLF
jgi:hypothetical protein